MDENMDENQMDDLFYERWQQQKKIAKNWTSETRWKKIMLVYFE
jgi:hypothetical protein